MGEEEKKTVFDGTDILLMLFMGAVVSFGLTRAICEKLHKEDILEYRKQAVDHGYAEFKTDGNEITFSWIEK